MNSGIPHHQITVKSRMQKSHRGSLRSAGRCRCLARRTRHCGPWWLFCGRQLSSVIRKFQACVRRVAQKFFRASRARRARNFTRRSRFVRAAKCVVESANFDSTVRAGNGERYEESASAVAPQRAGLRLERRTTPAQNSARPHRWNRVAEASGTFRCADGATRGRANDRPTSAERAADEFVRRRRCTDRECAARRADGSTRG